MSAFKDAETYFSEGLPDQETSAGNIAVHGLYKGLIALAEGLHTWEQQVNRRLAYVEDNLKLVIRSLQ